jgi:hypothetical protein
LGSGLLHLLLHLLTLQLGVLALHFTVALCLRRSIRLNGKRRYLALRGHNTVRVADLY